MVIQPGKRDCATSSAEEEWWAQVKADLHAENLRLVSEVEVTKAILYDSVSSYCNPQGSRKSFSQPSSIFTTASQSGLLALSSQAAEPSVSKKRKAPAPGLAKTTRLAPPGPGNIRRRNTPAAETGSLSQRTGTQRPSAKFESHRQTQVSSDEDDDDVDPFAPPPVQSSTQRSQLSSPASSQSPRQPITRRACAVRKVAVVMDDSVVDTPPPSRRRRVQEIAETPEISSAAPAKSPAADISSPAHMEHPGTMTVGSMASDQSVVATGLSTEHADRSELALKPPKARAGHRTGRVDDLDETAIESPARRRSAGAPTTWLFKGKTGQLRSTASSRLGARGDHNDSDNDNDGIDDEGGSAPVVVDCPVDFMGGLLVRKYQPKPTGKAAKAHAAVAGIVNFKRFKKAYYVGSEYRGIRDPLNLVNNAPKYDHYVEVQMAEERATIQQREEKQRTVDALLSDAFGEDGGRGKAKSKSKSKRKAS